MGRPNLIRINNLPYHITTRCNNREWFDLPLQRVWDICINSIAVANFKFPVQIEAFVLMNNHYHLLLYTPNADVDRFMHILNSNISKRLREETLRVNRIFGNRYSWIIIQDQNHYKNVVRYIFQNPLRAGLASRCENYPNSTLFYQVRGRSFSFKLPDRFKEEISLDFLNQEMSRDEMFEIKCKLDKRTRL
ncbi:MAG: transposase [Bdellovibrio sp.]|nr:transposase [Bdellovibrio sp.]